LTSGATRRPDLDIRQPARCRAGCQTASGSRRIARKVGRCGTTNPPSLTRNPPEACAWLVRRQASARVPFFRLKKEWPMPAACVDVCRGRILLVGMPDGRRATDHRSHRRPLAGECDDFVLIAISATASSCPAGR
jgi:hypothetical protein